MSGQELLLVARVAGAFGVKGEIRITTFTDDPLALARYKALLRRDGSPGLTITSARIAKGGVVARAKEVATREEAEALRGLQLFISRDILPPPEEDEFYLADLNGMAIVAPDGAAIGSVKSVHDFGAGDLLEVLPEGGGATWWLPFTREAVPEVRLADRVLVAVRPPEVE